jgi:hypothetical protein
MSKRLASIAVIIAVLTLAGCSNGSDSSAPASIKTSSAAVIAASVVGSAENVGDLGFFVFFGPTPTISAPSQSILATKVGEARNAGIEALVRHVQALPLATLTPQTTPCTDGGRVTVSGDVATQVTLTPNDTIVFDFALCREGEATVNGRVSMQFASFSGDPSSDTFSLDIDLQVSDFEATVAGKAATLNGPASLVIDVTPDTVTTTVTSTSISVAHAGSTSTFSNYSSITMVTSGSVARVVNGTLTSSGFDGSVTFDTTKALQGANRLATDVGQVIITGANGGTIKVVVLDATSVRLDVDTNGDGTADATFDVTWAELT